MIGYEAAKPQSGRNERRNNMNEAKHTPGKWTVMQNPGDPSDKRIYVGTVKKPIANTCELYGDESHANARLISCAPELLEALDELVTAECHAECNGSCEPAVTQCWLWKYKQLIARAKGGTE